MTGPEPDGAPSDRAEHAEPPHPLIPGDAPTGAAPMPPPGAWPPPPPGPVEPSAMPWPPPPPPAAPAYPAAYGQQAPQPYQAYAPPAQPYQPPQGWGPRGWERPGGPNIPWSDDPRTWPQQGVPPTAGGNIGAWAKTGPAGADPRLVPGEVVPDAPDAVDPRRPATQQPLPPVPPDAP